MSKFKLTLKGLLFYTTVFMTALFLATIESLFTSLLIGIVSIIILFFLYILCYKVISKDELETLTLCKLFNINIHEE